MGLIFTKAALDVSVPIARPLRSGAWSLRGWPSDKLVLVGPSGHAQDAVAAVDLLSAVRVVVGHDVRAAILTVCDLKCRAVSLSSDTITVTLPTGSRL